jgi:hypothetical protein
MGIQAYDDPDTPFEHMFLHGSNMRSNVVHVFERRRPLAVALRSPDGTVGGRR